jgi:hypothetical protein
MAASMLVGNVLTSRELGEKAALGFAGGKIGKWLEALAP